VLRLDSCIGEHLPGHIVYMWTTLPGLLLSLGALLGKRREEPETLAKLSGSEPGHIEYMQRSVQTKYK
jgi:hypothetical protein